VERINGAARLRRLVAPAGNAMPRKDSLPRCQEDTEAAGRAREIPLQLPLARPYNKGGKEL